MYLLGKVGSPEQKERFLKPMVAGEARSAFFMTEPADEGGAGSDPSMMQTTAGTDGNHWVINGRKAFITGARGREGRHRHGEVGRRRLHVPGRPAGSGDPIDRVLDTIDSSMPGGHAVVDDRQSAGPRRPDARRRAARASNMRRSASARPA